MEERELQGSLRGVPFLHPGSGEPKLKCILENNASELGVKARPRKAGSQAKGSEDPPGATKLPLLKSDWIRQQDLCPRALSTATRQPGVMGLTGTVPGSELTHHREETVQHDQRKAL